MNTHVLNTHASHLPHAGNSDEAPSLLQLGAGPNVPFQVHAVIEIAHAGGPVKYEYDKRVGMLAIDRILGVSMQYPANYGFIPSTLSQDGDPCDVLVCASAPLLPGSFAIVRPVGVLMMEDEKGPDEKIIALLMPSSDAAWAHVNGIDQVPSTLKASIEHFFTTYKALEKGKWVKIGGWFDAAKAHQLILEGIDRATRSKI